MKKDARTILGKPLVTEKNQSLRDDENKVVFEVARDAQKNEIRRAVEEIFDVRVESVNTINVKGKVKRRGRFEGRSPDWKKAIIKLAEGETIDLFSGN